MDLIAALLRTRQQRRSAIAIIDGSEQLTWDQFVERTGRLACALKKLGVESGRGAAMLSYSSSRAFEFFYAVPWAGGMMCPLNVKLSATELTEILVDAAIDTIIVDDAFLDMGRTLRERVPTLRNIIHAGPGSAPVGFIAYEDLIAGSPPLREHFCREDDVACLYYTGGTTGKMKGVMLTHANVFANAINFGLASGVSDQDRFLHCGPLFHVAAGSRVFNAGTFGATSIIMPRFEPGAVLENIERHQITVLSLVPTMLNAIIQLPQFTHHDLSSVRMIFYGAAPIPLPLLQAVMTRFAGISLCQVYGQTETAPFATVLGPRYHTLKGRFAGKLNSAGRAIGSVEVRVVDPEDNELPAGTVGEVIVRGPNVMKGYLNQQEVTKSVLRSGWMHSGDLGYFDDDGFLFIVDRMKDMIISGGENIYSVEVESAIASHPDVAECAVVGVPHETWGESVHAVVVLTPGKAIEPQAIIDHCLKSIGRYKAPRSVEIRTNPLPLSGANKILKRTLRDEYLRSLKSSSPATVKRRFGMD
jgi:long-chain acyl-CoA synthetase